MKYFCIPADFKCDSIDRICELNNKYSDNKVIETYGQASTVDINNSCRDCTLMPPVDLIQLEKYVRYLRDKGLDFNYTLNPLCLGNKELTTEGIRSIYRLLISLKNIGIDTLTITLPSLMEAVNTFNLGFKIVASAICFIDSVKKAEYYKDMGVSRIVTDPNINRNFKILKNISSLMDGNIEIIANNMCLKSCPTRQFHYNYLAHMPDINENKNYFSYKCNAVRASKIENYTRQNWVRPEDMKYYRSVGIKYFKLVDRTNIYEGDIIKALEYYFIEDYDGNLDDLLYIFMPMDSLRPYIDNKKLDGFVKGFFDNEQICRDDCNNCNYCKNFAKRAIMNEESNNEFNKKILQLDDDSEYIQLIREIMNEENGIDNSNCYPDGGFVNE